MTATQLKPIKTTYGTIGNDGQKTTVRREANRVFRWNILFLVVIVGILIYPIWISFIPVVRRGASEMILLTMICFHFSWLLATLNSIITVYHLRKQKRLCGNTKVDVEADKKVPQFNADRLKHIVGICVYKEPLDVLKHTIESLVKQYEALERVCLIVGMEEGTPDREAKTTSLFEAYEKKFNKLIVTAHPRGVEGEIPGKCSNFNYASREGVRILRNEILDFAFHEYILTTADCDTVFSEDYTRLLEQDYLSLDEQQRDATVWQSPLFYQMGLNKSPFFVRITGLLRSFFMMGMLIPWNINTMSVFSLSLRLYEAGKYTHPGYQMDDIIALIRWTLITKKLCNIRLLKVATLSGPTSGATYYDELREWARQIRRWTIGAAEVFHYFVVKCGRIPILVAFTWGLRFFLYYGVILCVAPIFSITAPTLSVLISQLFDESESEPVYLVIPPTIYTYINLALFFLQYFWFFMVFLLNYLAESSFPDGHVERTEFYKDIYQWLLTFPTILAYCFIELASFVEVAIRGKDVCEHKPSKKNNLRIHKY